jgi:putative ATPase
MTTEVRGAGWVVSVVQGDLTRQDVDAVVNAANERLAHGGGVAAALVRAGGAVVQEESDAWVAAHGPVRTGEAAVTTAGAMAARHVIHVVGPRYREGQDNEGMLRAAVEAALDAAAAAGDRSVAFPAISAGIFGYPLEEATSVIASEVVAWLNRDPGRVSEVRLVGFDATVTSSFGAALSGVAGLSDSDDRPPAT